MPTIDRLRCKECNHENEPERVYCHNCGAKLDRTLVIKQQREQEAQREKELKKMPKSRLAPGKPVVKPFVLTLLFAFIVGCLIQMARVPEGIPDRPEDLLDYPPVGMDLADRTISGQANIARYSEDEVNAYLAGSVKSKSDGVMADYVKFGRPLALFDDGHCTVGFEQLVLDYPLYVMGSYEVEMVGGELVATSIGGKIGRLPIPAIIMKYADQLLFKHLKEALKRDVTTLSRVSGVKFTEDLVELQIPGNQ